MTVIDTPGVYDGMTDAVYHGDPVPAGSLSSSGARKLLPPSCPARFAHDRKHPPASTSDFDFGHAAHLEVLGAGPKLVVVDADSWRTNAAKDARAEAYAAGHIPLLAYEAEKVQEMAAVLRAHPIVGPLLAPGTGVAEQSLFWVDDATGVWRRARTDWLKNPVAGRRRLVVDYKTCTSAAPDDLQRSIYQYGYHQQAAWYLDGVQALGLDSAPAFVFVFQEKTPPYLVTVAQADHQALLIGAALNRRALEVYRDCAAAGRWPGYSDDVETIPLPA